MQEQVEQKKKLRLAALCGNAARVNELLSGGTTLDGVEDPNERLSILTQCTQLGHVDVVRVLLEHGASPSGEFRPGQTVPFKKSPLYYALKCKSDEIAMVLIQYSSGNLLAYYKAVESDVLQQAVKNNHLAFTQLLLDYGYDATYQDVSGNTLLHLNETIETDWTLEKAITHDREDLVRHYLDQDVSYSWKNIFDDYGNSLLTTAIEKGSLRSAAILIEYGANIAGNEPVRVRRKNGTGNREMWYGSVDYGGGRYTPIQMAMMHHHEDFAFDILYGLMHQNESIDKDGLLTQAIQSGCLNLVRYMMQNKWDANSYDLEGKTPLMNALASKQDEIALLLIGCGADINARDMNGLTPITYAAMNANENMVQLLIDMSVQIEETNHNPDVLDVLLDETKDQHHGLYNMWADEYDDVLNTLVKEIVKLISYADFDLYSPEVGEKIRAYCAIHDRITHAKISRQETPAPTVFDRNMAKHLSLIRKPLINSIFLPETILHLVYSFLDISDIWHLWHLSKIKPLTMPNNAPSNNVFLVNHAYINMRHFQPPPGPEENQSVYKRGFSTCSSTVVEEHKDGDDDENYQKRSRIF